MIRIIIIIIGIFFLHNTSYAQFELKIKSNHTYDSIAYLRGVIFDDKNFIPKDTIELYKELNTIKNTKPIIGGIYFLYFPKSKKKLFLAIENNDNILVSISDTQYINTVHTNSIKNDSFISYQKLEQSKLFHFESFIYIKLKIRSIKEKILEKNLRLFYDLKRKLNYFFN